MISTLQQTSLYPAANADYSGWGAFNMWHYLSATSAPPPAGPSTGDKQFIGEIQQMGTLPILDASMGLV